jgi:ubiquitin-protein ligase
MNHLESKCCDSCVPDALQIVLQTVLTYHVCDQSSFLAATRVSRFWWWLLSSKRNCLLDKQDRLFLDKATEYKNLDAMVLRVLCPEWRGHQLDGGPHGLAPLSSALCATIREQLQFMERANTCLSKADKLYRAYAETQKRWLNLEAPFKCLWGRDASDLVARPIAQQVVLPLVCAACCERRLFSASEWIAVCCGPAHSRYAGCLFVFHMHLRALPFQPPVIRLLTPVAHPNVNTTTRVVELEIFRYDWSPALRAPLALAVLLQSLLGSPVLDTCHDIPHDSDTTSLQSHAGLQQRTIPTCPCGESKLIHTLSSYLHVFATLSSHSTSL